MTEGKSQSLIPPEREWVKTGTLDSLVTAADAAESTRLLVVVVDVLRTLSFMKGGCVRVWAHGAKAGTTEQNGAGQAKSKKRDSVD